MKIKDVYHSENLYFVSFPILYVYPVHWKPKGSLIEEIGRSQFTTICERITRRTRHEAAKKEGKTGSGKVRQACNHPPMPTACAVQWKQGQEGQKSSDTQKGFSLIKMRCAHLFSSKKYYTISCLDLGPYPYIPMCKHEFFRCHPEETFRSSGQNKSGKNGKLV